MIFFRESCSARARINLQRLYKLFSLQLTFARHWKILSVVRNNAKTGVREVNSRSVRFPVILDFGSHRKSLNFTRAAQKASGDLPVIPVYLWYIQLVRVSILHFINFLLQQSYSLIYTWLRHSILHIFLLWNTRNVWL